MRTFSFILYYKTKSGSMQEVFEKIFPLRSFFWFKFFFEVLHLLFSSQPISISPLLEKIY